MAGYGVEQPEGESQPQSEYIKLVRKHKNNLRAVLQEIESGAMLS